MLVIAAFVNLEIEKQVDRLLVFLHLAVGFWDLDKSGGAKTLFPRFYPKTHRGPFRKSKTIRIWIVSFRLLFSKTLLNLFLDASLRR